MVMPADLGRENTGARLAEPALRRAVEAAVKRRVPGDDAEDIVQAALADILSAACVPEDAEEFRRFVFAVTRNKVFDHFRRRAREVPEDDALEPVASEAPLAARDILRWAEQKLPDSEAQHTFEWMLREGDGEKLEQIARDANLPAPRVRKRVSRLRRYLRERWAAELLLSALGLVVLAAGAIYYFEHHHKPDDIAKHEPEVLPEPPASPEQQGRELRRAALERCQNGTAQQCLDGLDRARALDPNGDAAPEVVHARSAAGARLAPAPSAAPAPRLESVPSARPVRSRAPISTESSLPSVPPTPTPSPSGSSDSPSERTPRKASPHKANTQSSI